ncbi:MAG: hypothetical protein FWH22_09800 [Fibromonadales bacterium]|nr:hypothetical protein [Fibromonadales bacterium]
MKTKRFLLVAVLAALAFTFSACSDDNDDKVIGTCTVDMGEGGSICNELNEGMDTDDGEFYCEYIAKGTWVEKGRCESNAQKKCQISHEGAKITAHVYGSISEMSCDEIEDYLVNL